MVVNLSAWTAAMGSAVAYFGSPPVAKAYYETQAWDAFTEEFPEYDNAKTLEVLNPNTAWTTPSVKAWDTYRHTYVAGRFAQLYGEEATRVMGEVNEWWHGGLQSEGAKDLVNNDRGIDAAGNTGYFNPLGTDQDLIDYINDELHKAIDNPGTPILSDLVLDAQNDPRAAWADVQREDIAEDLFDEFKDGSENSQAKGLILDPHADNTKVPLPERKPDSSYIDQVCDKIELAESRGDPLVFDLDDSGTIDLTSLSSSTTYWNIDGDAFAEASGWVSSSDGTLAIDHNENGWIDDQSELFGTIDTDGFTILAQYDSNHDGKITDADSVWSDLVIWRDDNSNGYSEDSEQYAPSDFDIVSIELAFSDVSQINQGHSVTRIGTFTVDDGVNPTDTREVHSVSFEFDNTNSVYVGDYTPDVRVAFLPTLRGFGNLPDLYIAMSLDNDGTGNLLDLVKDFKYSPAEDLFDGSNGGLNTVIDIMYRWAGVDEVLPNSRGSNIDAQQLEFIEELLGQEYFHHAGPNPGPVPALDLQEAFQIALDAIFARLAAQTEGGAQLFEGDFHYNATSDTFEDVSGLNSDTLDALETEALTLTDTEERTVFWQNVVRVVDGVVGLGNLTGGDETALDDAITGSDGSLDLDMISDSLAFQPPIGSTYSGTSSDDTITAGSGNDTLNGDSGNDTLNGDDGNDIIYGDPGDDVLWGEAGNDWMRGGSGNDQYHWQIGDGDDWITESGSGAGNDDDRIVFGTGIDIGDLTISRVTNSGLLIKIDNGTDTGTISIEGQFNYSPGGGHVELIEFFDTSTYRLDNKNYTLNGTQSDDYLEGLAAGGLHADTINGGNGNDIIYGGAPNQSIRPLKPL